MSLPVWRRHPPPTGEGFCLLPTAYCRLPSFQRVGFADAEGAGVVGVAVGIALFGVLVVGLFAVLVDDGTDQTARGFHMIVSGSVGSARFLR